MKDLLYKIFLFWRSVGRIYDKINADPQKREKDVSLGVTSLVMSIVGMAVTVVAAYFAFKCFTWTADATTSAGGAAVVGFFAWFGGAICVLFSVGCFIYMVLASIVYAHYQRKLNNNPIGLAALIIGILLSIGTIIAVIVVLLLFAPTKQ